MVANLASSQAFQLHSAATQTDEAGRRGYLTPSLVPSSKKGWEAWEQGYPTPSPPLGGVCVCSLLLIPLHQHQQTA